MYSYFSNCKNKRNLFETNASSHLFFILWKVSGTFHIPNYFHIYLRHLKMTYFFFSGVLLCENIIQAYSFVQLLKICWIKHVPWLWFSYNALYSRAFSTVYITLLGPINPYCLGYKHDQKPLLLALYCIAFVLFSSSSLVSCLWQNDVMLCIKTKQSGRSNTTFDRRL